MQPRKPPKQSNSLHCTIIKQLLTHSAFKANKLAQNAQKKNLTNTVSLLRQGIVNVTLGDPNQERDRCVEISDYYNAPIYEEYTKQNRKNKMHSKAQFSKIFEYLRERQDREFIEHHESIGEEITDLTSLLKTMEESTLVKTLLELQEKSKEKSDSTSHPNVNKWSEGSPGQKKEKISNIASSISHHSQTES